LTEDERPGRETDVPEGNNNLIKELETLYHKVAALDAPDLDPDNVVDFHAAYSILRIAPGASWQEIQAAYEKLNDAWREDRYPQALSGMKRRRLNAGRLNRPMKNFASFMPCVIKRRRQLPKPLLRSVIFLISQGFQINRRWRPLPMPMTLP